VKRTGWSATEALKRGVALLDEQLDADLPAQTAFDLYAALDLGPGGYAAGPASASRETVHQVSAAKRKAAE
jgi:hypothetical protein